MTTMTMPEQGATLTSAIRVMVVDDHPLVRGGLIALLGGEPDIEVVGAVGTGEEAVVVGMQTMPDVILMDVQLPGIDGIEATRLLRASGSSAAVVVLTSFSDSDRILNAFKAGAIGYLLKDTSPQEVLAGVRAAAEGNSPIAPQAAKALVEDRRKDDPTPTSTSTPSAPHAQERLTSRLTEREIEVLRLVRDGHANKQIARLLAISEATVKAHLTSIFQRIDVRDRTQAALWAQERGL
jgi:DNA-binding NarL/FixJ family response regulator